ncbi:MAG TPA: DNA starvation/stationary phase protection protein [Stellaceae bacterium]|nr:DNA starvation/stationary phase protection protein [Stellaceae bacterium]
MKQAAPSASHEAQPHYGQHGPEIQAYGTVTKLPIGLGQNVRLASVEMLNQVLVDTMTLRDLYKKAHWQVSGHTFYQLHLLFDKHYTEQAELVDMIAERIQSLGGIALAMAHDVAEMTTLDRPPRGREQVPTIISRLLSAHEKMLVQIRKFAHEAAENGDDGTNDLLVSDLIRLHEMQVWFVAEHLVDTPLV